MSYTKKVATILPFLRNTELIRNVGILAHIDHGKTTLSDNLLAYCGFLSTSLAGEARALDYLEEEQKRGITIKSANISLPYQMNDKKYIINLIDTPGHVDFSGARDQSLRVIDGAVIVIDAVEGCMVQTEIVTKHALEEYIKPILFINKVDRLITELKLSLKEIESRFNEIIQDFNNFIELYAPEPFKDAWKIEVKKNNIGFGSALHLWGCTAKEMLQQDIKFKEIIGLYKDESMMKQYSQIAKRLPLSKSIFNMIINHLPSPRYAQEYRIPNLWFGNVNSKIGHNLVKCEQDGAILLYIYKNIADKNLGTISLGRLFSGTLENGKEVFSLTNRQFDRIQQLFLFMGSHREIIRSIPAGNIVAFNIKTPKIGDTLVEKNFEDTPPFEKIIYETEAVVQYSIEPLHPRQLKNMLSLLDELSINDPNLEITTNEETGEILISGLGELHLELIINELKKKGLEIIVSDPIVTFRESICKKTEKIISRSVNAKNFMEIVAEPLESQIIDLLTSGQLTIPISENRKTKLLRGLVDWNPELIQRIIYFDNFGNLIFLLDDRYKLKERNDIAPFLYHQIKKIFRFGPLIRDPIRGLKIMIKTLKIQSEEFQLDYLQLIPLLKDAVSQILNSPDKILLQPIYKIQIKTLSSYIGSISSILAQVNGKISKIEQKGHNIFITGDLPVRGSFGLAKKMRSKTSGHVFWQTFFSKWERITPDSVMKEIIKDQRIKRGFK
ncbi:MAG: GTP-binding protein [Candidatus Helarchaeota archaeon]